jgi:hypothetical protein
VIYLASPDAEELDEIRQRFRAGGIPIYLEPDYARDDIVAGVATAFRNATTGPQRYRLYVCIETQLEEAKHLLANKHYKVRAPVDVAKFEATMEKLGANRKMEWRLTTRAMNWMVAVVVVAFLLWVLRAVLRT